MKAFNYFFNYYTKSSRFLGKVSIPENVNFPITDNCNSQCIMCDVWKENSTSDMTVDQIDKVFSNKLFKNIKHIGLSGGEPTLRKDLLDVVLTLVKRLNKLETLSITSHGYHHDIWAKLIPSIKEICKESNIRFTLNISIDGREKIHNQNRGIETAFSKAQKTISLAKENDVKLQLQHTVTPINFNNLNSSFETLIELNDDFIMRRSVEVARLDNKDTIQTLGSYQRLDSVFSDFLSFSKLLSYTKNPARRLFYKDLANRLANKTKRKAPCYFQNEGVVVTPTGDLYHCSISYDKIGNCIEEDAYTLYFSEKSQRIRENLKKNICPFCLHDQSGAWSPFELAKEVVTSNISNKVKLVQKIWHLFSAFTHYLFSEIKVKFSLPSSISNNVKHAIIIGAYGGEHVGDSAILGGVILRLINQFGIKSFTILSFRPDRTKIWVDGLIFDKDISIIVKEKSKFKEIDKKIEDCILVYAGGPIMELLEDMMSNLRIVNYFLWKKSNFIIEGCGFGPFNTKLGMFFGQQFLSKAYQVTLRQNAKTSVSYKLNHDPAFDYLYANNNISTFVPNDCKEFVSRYDKIVILNLRPLWAKYSQSLDIDLTTNKIYDALVQTIKQNPNVGFIYLPFNFDHYGFSDIPLAFEIKKMLLGAPNYKIIEKELTYKEIIHYIKIAKYAICMRFHACIFSSALGLKTMGIDYSANGKGKVNGLYEMNLIHSIESLLTINSKSFSEFIKD